MTNTNLWQYTNEKYDKISDEEIIKLIKSGDKSALDFIMNKYKEVVNIKVSKYFIIGAEKEDIIQEGLIGLYKAIKNFDPEKENSFRIFLILYSIYS